MSRVGVLLDDACLHGFKVDSMFACCPLYTTTPMGIANTLSHLLKINKISSRPGSHLVVEAGEKTLG